MTAIATAKGASTKSCDLSQEKFDAIVPSKACVEESRSTLTLTAGMYRGGLNYYAGNRHADCADSIAARSIDRCAINGSIDGAAQSMDRANPSIARNRLSQAVPLCQISAEIIYIISDISVQTKNTIYHPPQKNTAFRL